MLDLHLCRTWPITWKESDVHRLVWLIGELDGAALALHSLTTPQIPLKRHSPSYFTHFARLFPMTRRLNAIHMFFNILHIPLVQLDYPTFRCVRSLSRSNRSSSTHVPSPVDLLFTIHGCAVFSAHNSPDSRNFSDHQYGFIKLLYDIRYLMLSPISPTSVFVVCTSCQST